MFSKFILILVLALAEKATFEESANYEFVIVSTTQAPAQNKQCDDRLTKIEERLEFHTKVEETSRRLDAIEFQNKQVQKVLENINFALENFKNQLTKVAENSHKLEALELQLKQIQSTSNNINSTNLHLKVLENGQKLEAMELQIKQIQSTSNNVNSTNLHSKVLENTQKLEAMELQIKQIQDTWDNINSTNLQSKVLENSQKLEAIEVQNQQIQKSLENVTSLFTSPKSPNTLVEKTPQKLVQKRCKNTELASKSNQIDSLKSIPRNCREIKKKGGNISKLYRIKPNLSSDSFLVWCDMETKGGGWTYFLNRFDGSQDFNLTWTEYKNGFGNLSGEFWLGLEHLYQLTGNEISEMLVVLVDKNKKSFAHYVKFSIGNETEGYNLKLLQMYLHSAGDGLHAGMKFTTGDKDQDTNSGGNCALLKGGGWWYKDCGFAGLTGRYLNEGNTGMMWRFFNFKRAKMMVRPRVIHGTH